MKTTNRFIAAALEELSQEVGPSVAVTTPAVSNGNTDGTTVKVNVDDSADAVAELMEKNSELIDTNATLESESFDNDLNDIATSSDTVTSDLEDAVAAGVALENLAELINVSIRTKQVNPTAVAGFAMALEHISHRAKVSNPIPALEAETLQLEGPAGQAKSIGEAAVTKAKEIAKRLMDGIKRIVGWFLSMIRTFVAHSTVLHARAKAALQQVDDIDDTKTITSQPFIASLRLVKGAGEAPQQFEAYANLAKTALYGFFNHSFGVGLSSALSEFRKGDTSQEMHNGVKHRLVEIIKVLQSTVYPENGTMADVPVALYEGVKEEQLSIGKTVPCVGGSQLYLAATLMELKETGTWFIKSGLAKNQPEIDMPESIPVVPPKMAKKMLATIQIWMKDQKKLEDTLKGIEGFKNFAEEMTWVSARMYLETVTALASGCVPHLLRLNMKNSASFIAYVEKSIAVSKAGTADAKA